ncbi:DNA polymerase III subunit delta' [Parashewanella tropica]|uniref:DNA polymerase III subunit delta' n=1 Tax=Parashewanella tropica TaxID=2547970 RepID=UPI00105A30E7|nr:DNA polymerase III subunit delta' [Parashewanella tropica]
MVKLTQLSWLDDARQVFYNQLNSDSLPHAQLLGIESGYGAELLLAHLAQTALCEKLTSKGACGFCRGCHLVEAGNHPDLHTIKPDGSQIKVDQVRQLCQSLATTAQQSGRRVAVIHHCEKLNQAAANALLKTLEEPGDDTLLLLQTDSPNLLMATISSRCQKLAIKKPDKKQILDWLSQHSDVKGDATWCIPLVGGPLELMLAIDSGHYQALLNYRKAWSESLSLGHLSQSFLATNDQDIVDALDVLYLVLRQFVLQGKYNDALLQSGVIALASEVMQVRQKLTMMSNINAPALCQQFLIKYRHLVNS